ARGRALRPGRARGRTESGRLERADVVAAHEIRIADEQREEARVFAARSVAAVMQATEGERVKGGRHEVAAVIGEQARVLDGTKRRRRLETIPLTLHRARGAVV